MGVQMDVPIGFRREFAALRNAELQLARERAVLEGTGIPRVARPERGDAEHANAHSN
jgi:hypothetical protein